MALDPVAKSFFGSAEDVEMRAGGSADAVKQATAAAGVFIEEAGDMTTQLVKFAQAWAREKNLSPKHLAFAMSLAGINCRQTYPDGVAAYDAETKDAWAYYEAQEPKLAAKG